MKSKIKRTDKVLMSIFLSAVVVAVLIAAIAVFDPTGLLRAARPTQAPPPPRTPEADECIDDYLLNLPDIPVGSKDCNLEKYDQCVANVTRAEEACRRRVPAGVRNREERLNECAYRAAVQLRSTCTGRYCRLYNDKADDLLGCIKDLPRPTPTPSSKQETTPKPS